MSWDFIHARLGLGSHPGAPPAWERCTGGQGGTHHVDDVEGEDLDAADNGGERADDGGEDSQAADAEEEILGEERGELRAPAERGGCAAAPRGPLAPACGPPPSAPGGCCGSRGWGTWSASRSAGCRRRAAAPSGAGSRRTSPFPGDKEHR